MKVSIVVPCHNEQEVLPLLHHRISHASKAWDFFWEVILVDDGSKDQTWNVIQTIAREDMRFRGVKLARNFGHQFALGAGMEAATGSAVVAMDADLQDPPELVAKMYTLWQQGNHVVYGQRTRRHGETMFKKFFAYAFYWMFDRLTTIHIPQNTGDFALMDRRVVDALLAMRDRSLFWRGMRCWAGFKHIALEFERPPRAAGEPSYNFRQSFALAMNALLLYSHIPFRVPLYLSTFSFITSCVLLGVGMLHGSRWYYLSSGILFVASLQFACMAIMSEYLGRIYTETLDRPRWIIERQTSDVELGKTTIAS